jgi:predicted nucleic acid-binding protein
MKEKIVINSSPIILLHKADLEFLLPALFSSIIIPDGVMDEISVHEEDDVASRIRSQSDFTICRVPLERTPRGQSLALLRDRTLSAVHDDLGHNPGRPRQSGNGG